MPYWLTPPELYHELDREFHFNFDPCPYPRPIWDGLEVEWGSRTYCNPPYLKKDGGPIRLWMDKALEEYAKGKTVVMLVPFHNIYLKPLLIDDPRFRFLGRMRSHCTETGKPGPNPPNEIVLIILKHR